MPRRRRRRHDDETEAYTLTLIDGALGYIRNVSNRSTGEIAHHHGEADHQAVLERPYHEAIAAIGEKRRPR
jgi:hypothetical protein